MTKRSKASTICATVVIFINIIAVMISLTIFALGLWVIISPKTIEHVIQMLGTPVIKALFPDGSLTLQLGISMSLLGIFLLFISMMGLYGAVCNSPFLLFMYAALVLLLMLLECAVFFYFTSNIVEKGVKDNSQLDHAFRLMLHCCDHYQNYSNGDVPKSVPWSCCGAIVKNCSQERIYLKNCKDTMSNWLHHYGTIVYGSLVTSHVILSSCSLLRRASSASRSHT